MLNEACCENFFIAMVPIKFEVNDQLHERKIAITSGSGKLYKIMYFTWENDFINSKIQKINFADTWE